MNGFMRSKDLIKHYQSLKSLRKISILNTLNNKQLNNKSIEIKSKKNNNINNNKYHYPTKKN